jgi:capsular polysaccharide biosynthesis protein
MKKNRVLSISAIVSFLMIITFFQPASAGMVGTLNLQPEYQPFTDVLQTRQEIQNRG